MENWFVPHQESILPHARRVLVFAPHPDDEVFGCAGAIVKYVRRNATIGIVVFTTGCAYLDGHEKEAMKATRQQESMLAAQILGCPSPEFLDFEDRQLNQVPHLKELIQAKIDTFQPDLIFVPSLWEIHPDHRALCISTLSCAMDAFEASKAQFHVMQYEVSAPLNPNFILDISECHHLKDSAVQSFGSQLLSKPYDVCIKGLNQYRTLTLNSGTTQAEAYVLLGSKDIRSWVKDAFQMSSPSLKFTHDHALVNAYQDREQLKIEFDKVRSDLEQLTSQFDLLNVQLEATQKDLHRDKMILAATQASWSWRLTKPLRALGAMLRDL
jgi:LmbE family N-acetylglucosaminyl deacetylase